MAKPGRNDPCPCGSGKKYKQCCLARDEAAQAPPDRSNAERSASADRFKSTLAAIMAGTGAVGSDDEGDAVMDASNAVVDLVRAGKLDEAEAAARALLARYPEVPDGWDRLGMVHEARGENALAADCYRKVVEFLDQNPDYSEPAFRASFVERIAKLAPPAAT